MHGSGPDRLWNPDDAIMLPGGDIVTADIKDQRILLIGPGAHIVLRQWGTPGQGHHQPPTNYCAPYSVFPTGRGRFLVTEIRGDWVDSIDLHGHVFFSTHPPGIAYPSDSNQISPNRYLTVDYSRPGQILIFDHTGKAIWRYQPTGVDALDHRRWHCRCPTATSSATTISTTASSSSTPTNKPASMPIAGGP